MTCIVCKKSFNQNIQTDKCKCKCKCKCVYRCDICEEVYANNHIKNYHYCDECVKYIEDIQDTQDYTNNKKK